MVGAGKRNKSREGGRREAKNNYLWQLSNNTPASTGGKEGVGMVWRDARG